MKGMGSHQSAKMLKEEWVTPRYIVDALGHFDLDPCAPMNPPWPIADHQYTMMDNGLNLPWTGRVWLNPPYGRDTNKWLARLAFHQDGIALIFARTETEMFWEQVWKKGYGILFLRGRLFFHHVNGSKAKSNAGAPSCLVAYDADNYDALMSSGLPGQYFQINTGTWV